MGCEGIVGERARVPLDDAPADAEAEPRTLAHLLGGEERAEDLARDVRAIGRPESSTRIETSDAPVVDGGQPDPRRCRRPRSIERVVEQVHEHLRELDRTTANARLGAHVDA